MASSRQPTRSCARAVGSPHGKGEPAMTKIREFATTGGSPGPRMWCDRDKEELIGSAKGAPEDIPNFRPFDMLAEPNQSLVVLQNQDMRVGVENLSGTQPAFHRNSDYDTLYF